MPTEQEFISQLGKELGVLPKVIFVAGPPYLDVSSSLLKERVSNNKSVRYLLPRAVEVYIQQKSIIFHNSQILLYFFLTIAKV
jgi:nicotinic acid mononucleotide adenylyltransferase